MNLKADKKWLIPHTQTEHDAVQAYCKLSGVTISELIRRSLAQYVPGYPTYTYQRGAKVKTSKG